MRAMKDSGVPPIGTIPSGWHISRFKYELSVNDSGLWGKDPHGGSSDKVVIRSTEQSIDGKWLIQNPAIRDLSELNYSKYRIEVNDLLITKSSGSADHIGKTTLADSYFESHECYFSNFLQRLRLRTMVAKYAWYLLNSPITRLQFVYLQNSTSGIGNINAENINSIQIPVPPVKEQKSIVQFLDARCAAFDSLAEALRAQIDLLERYKRSVITEAVTKGLKPDVPMKESGIPWCQRIPAHWDALKLKYVMDNFDYERIPVDANKRSQDGEQLYDYYGASGIIDKINGYTSEGERILIGEDGANLLLRHLPLIYIATGKYWVNNHAHILKPKGNGNLHFFAYQMECIDYTEYITGSAQPKLSQFNLGRVWLVVPPIEEQEAIASFLDAKCAAIDSLISSKQAQLASLAALKKSLIFDYVTGKKEVPTP